MPPKTSSFLAQKVQSTENKKGIQDLSKPALQSEDNRPEAILQRKLGTLLNGSTVQKKENKTGLPNSLKSGIERLSGYSMDDVKVHYNSGKPAQLQAFAYAQGTEIHLGPGQEQHLPHEAWHVVQQKQGRVNATRQLKGTIHVNDSQTLEKEADLMGQSALSFPISSKPMISLQQVESDSSSVLQPKFDRLEVLPYPGEPPEMKLEPKKVGIVIEVMVPISQINIAYTKINQLANQDKSPIHTALSIGLNCNAKDKKSIGMLATESKKLLKLAKDAGVLCAVTPMVWKDPEKSGGGYVFPFIEAHYKLGQAEETKMLRQQLEFMCEAVFHRTMDADVSNDPLTDPKGPDGSLKDRDDSHQKISDVLADYIHSGKIITGGYKWKTDDLKEDPIHAKIIELLNEGESKLRRSIEESDKEISQSLYAPEPNTYIPGYLKDDWDRGLQSGLTDKSSFDRQMGEHTFGRKAVRTKGQGIHYDDSIATTKPRKAWLDNFGSFISAVKKKDARLAKAEFDKLKTEIHQSYLNPEVGLKIAKMQGEIFNKEKIEAMQALSREALESLWNAFELNFELAETK